MSIITQLTPQHLLHNLLRSRLDSRKESNKLFFAHAFPQTSYPLYFVINIRGTLYLLKERFCKQNTRQRNLVTVLIVINHPNIMERSAFATAITHFPCDAQGLLVVL